MTSTWPEYELIRDRRSPVVWALLLSLGLHVAAIVGWEVLQVAVRAFPQLFPTWVQQAVQPRPETPLAAQKPPDTYRPAPDEVEIPLTFIEVDPSLATEETPKESRFYSTANTLAGNPTPPKAGARDPFIDGWRENVPRTMDVPRPAPKPEVAATPPPPAEAERRPAPEAPRKEQQAQVAQNKVEEKPEAGLKPGEMQMAKANPNARVERPQPQPAQRPQSPRETQEAQPASPSRKYRRVAEAREAKGILVGEKMKQEGGVPRFQLESSLDVKASPFADYDAQLIYAVQQRWYALLDEQKFSLERTGKVVVRFNLHADGTISDMTQVQSDVGDLWAFICESAVMTPAPYARWPAAMRRLIGRDVRDVTFTFHYY